MTKKVEAKNKMLIKCLTISYIAKVSFGSPNGGDKDIDNVNPIKKVTLANGDFIPYISSQAVRRALRDGLLGLGYNLSEIDEASVKKGAPKTEMNPTEYIDDDLFGFMDAEKGKGASTRTSPLRVESLVGLSEYKGDLDFGTNYMGKDKGIDPNIYETEVYSGYFKGSLLIELDRVGCGSGFEKELTSIEKSERVKALINSFYNMWSSGRQSRFLSSISPKFISSAFMVVKNPIFLEELNIIEDKINIEAIEEVKENYSEFIHETVFGEVKSLFDNGDEILTLSGWKKRVFELIDKAYRIKNN